MLGNAFGRKLLLALVAGVGGGVGIGATMWTHALASPSTSPPVAVHECFNNSSKVVTYSSTGTCPSGTTAIPALAQQSGVAYLYTQVSSLQSLLAGVSRVTVNGYPTLRLSGVNLQVVNGSGSESTLNGLGNLIVGYANNGNSYARTGSHNLITGNNGGWTSYGGLLAGDYNRTNGTYASVSGGLANIASGANAAVGGGEINVATGSNAWVGGGVNDLASGDLSSVSGGNSNTAGGKEAFAAGGTGRTASNPLEAVFDPLASDGSTLTVTGQGAQSSSPLTSVLFNGVNVQVENGTGSESTLNGLGNLIVGYADNSNAYARTGSHNLITGDGGGWTSYGGLLAGIFDQITGSYASVSGGNGNIASGGSSSVSGGSLNTASGAQASVSGGESNNATGDFASVSGGRSNNASGAWDAILGGYNESIASSIHCAYFPGSATTSNC